MLRTSSVDEMIAQLKRKWIPIYLALLLATLGVTIALLRLWISTNNEQYFSAALLSLMLSSYISWYLVKVLRVKQTPRQLLTLVRCETCGYEEARLYTEGDALFQAKGTCPKCGKGDLVVVGIYLRVPVQVGEQQPNILSRAARFIMLIRRRRGARRRG